MDRHRSIRVLALITLEIFLGSSCGSLSTTPASPGDAVAPALRQKTASWMLRSAKSADLLYVSDGSSKVYVYSYPKGELVGTLTGLESPEGECVDKVGNVWVTQFSSSQVTEYPHGGTQAIATLTGAAYPNGCSVAPSTGNLAVAGNALYVYADAKGYPQTYSDSDFGGYFYCTYDGAGDLFADDDGAGIIAELPSGASQIDTVTLGEDLRTLSMQWDGSYLAIVGWLGDSSVRSAGDAGSSRGPLHVYRVSVSGSSGIIVGETLLKNPARKHEGVPSEQFLISAHTIIGPDTYRLQRKPDVLSWRYPRGGMPKIVTKIDWLEPVGTALSLAPRKR